jgi:hypothetical protein
MGKIMSNKKKDYSQDSWKGFKRYFAEYRKRNGNPKISSIQYISLRVMIWLIIFLLFDGFGIGGHLINLQNFLILIILLIALLLLYVIEFTSTLHRDYIRVIHIFGETGTHTGDAFGLVAKDMKTAQKNFKFLLEKYCELDHIVKHELLKQKIREKFEEAGKPIKPVYHGKKADQIIIDEPQKTEFSILPKTKENDPIHNFNSEVEEKK